MAPRATSPATGGAGESLLSPAEVRRFHEVGFVVRRGVFTADEVATMRAAFDRLARLATRLGDTAQHRGSLFVLRAARGDARPGIERIVWCGGAEPVLRRFGADPRLLRMAGELLGTTTMDQLINQAHFKLPGDAVEFPWHQDSRHRRYGGGEWTDVNGRGSYVQTVTAIDEATPHNGPLRFVAGSCRLGHVDGNPDGSGGLPAEAVDPARVVAPRLDPGDVVLFGPYTVHGSLPNRSDRPRRAFINGYCCPGANARMYPGAGTGRRLRVPPAEPGRGEPPAAAY